MYAKGMSMRKSSIILGFNAEDTVRLLKNDDQRVINKVIESSCRQVVTRRAFLPKKDAIMVITVSLSDEESEMLLDHHNDFRYHFVEIVKQQVNNTRKDILRFESEKSKGYVPNRMERRNRV